MGKNNRHQKNIKAEKAKVKLKAKKSKILPKGQNITDTTFKVKKIVIKEQLKEHEKEEILSRRKLTVKDLLARLQHHNSSVRQDAIRELKQILVQYPNEILSSYLKSLLQRISSLTLDNERLIRQDGVKILNIMLKTISHNQLAPFSDILISYLCCAMTHINFNVKEDSLNYLDVLIRHCGYLIAKNSHKILSYFLDLISRHHTQSQANRQLSLTLNSKNTSIQWRIKVLQRLSSIFKAIIEYVKAQRSENKNSETVKIVYVNEKTLHIPLYEKNNLKMCLINFDKNNLTQIQGRDDLETEEFNKYVEILIPLILESWLEVRPREKLSVEEAPLISNETADFLKSVTMNIQLIIEIIDIIEPIHNTISQNICDKFQKNIVKYLFNNFPYCHSNAIETNRKRQEDFEISDINSNCLEQNISLCYIFMWMISVNSSRILSDNIKEICGNILQFVNDSVSNWKYNDDVAEQMIKLLKLIFLKCTKILYKNNIELGAILHSIIIASYKQLKRDFNVKLFSILGDIILNNNLGELHNEASFEEFITNLPDFLLRNKIHDSTIRIINTVVLRYRHWVRTKLKDKHKDIMENAKTIEIIDTKNERESRLMIFNLFHFLDGEIYY